MPPTIEQQESLNRQAGLVKALSKIPVHEAVGIACSVLLAAALRYPEIVRRVLNEPVVREGFRGMSMLATLRRIAQ